MMRGFIIAALFAGFSSAHRGWNVSSFAHNASSTAHNASHASCICSADAAIVATDFGLLISNYTEALAVQLLAEGFTDQSDSVNTLIYEPGLQASDEAFLEGQGSQPPVPFEILNLWSTCDAVIIHWLSAQSPLPIRGISIAEVQLAKEGEGGGVGVGHQKWQIKTVIAEFNSGAWLGDLGYPECGVASTNATAAAK